MSVRLYVEGSGKSLKSAARKGFRAFFRSAGLSDPLPQVVPCGPRNDAYDRYAIALRNGEDAMLLVDAERPVAHEDPWLHLAQAPDEWSRPAGAKNDDCHLMVQVMESWFLADRDAVNDFYGQDFQSGSLPSNPAIEEISKDDVIRGLKAASRRTLKGQYDKGRHSFELIGLIDPGKVTEVSPYAKRLLDNLRES